MKQTGFLPIRQAHGKLMTRFAGMRGVDSQAGRLYYAGMARWTHWTRLKKRIPCAVLLCVKWQKGEFFDNFLEKGGRKL